MAADPDVLDSPQAGGTLIRGTLLRMVLFGGGLFVSLLTVPFLVRHLGPVEYGYYISVTAIISVIAGVTEGGLTNLGIRHYSTETDERARGAIVGNLVGVRLLVTTAAIAAITGVAALAGAAREIVIGLPLFGAGTLLTMISSTYAVPLQAQLRLGVSSGLEFGRQVVNSIGTIALVVVGAGLFAFFGLWIAACAVVTVATALIVRKSVPVRPAFHWPTWRGFLRDALAYGVAAAAGLVYFRMAASLMTFLSTEVETGYFGVAFRVLETGAVVPWLLVNSVFPILARAATRDRERLRYAAQRTVEVALILGAGLTLLIVIGARPIVAVVGGAEFADAVPALRVQALVLVGTVFVSAWSLLLLSLHEQKALLAVNGIAVLVSFAAAFVLIPALDAVGGSLDVLLAEVLVAVLSVIVLRRRHPDVAPELRRLWKVLLAVGLAFAASVPLGDVAGTAVALVVYAAVLLATRAVPMELWHAFRSARG